MMFVVDSNSCLIELQNASLWLRKKYQIPNNEIVTPYFEKEFKVKVFSDEYAIASSVEFLSEGHYTFFKIKWS